MCSADSGWSPQKTQSTEFKTMFLRANSTFVGNLFRSARQAKIQTFLGTHLFQTKLKIGCV
ncbi:hypothetical protein HanIR_Chr03g0105881 [Helianthus annuus]|nr:hypothetical protein HanIR_Chr03g0105881 [Helianthus annuus]